MSKLERLALAISITSALISGLSALVSFNTYKRAIPRVTITITREEYGEPRAPMGWPENVGMAIRIRNEGMTGALVDKVWVAWVIARRKPFWWAPLKRFPRPNSRRVFHSEMMAELSDTPLKIDSWDAVDKTLNFTIPDADVIPQITVLGANDLFYARAYLCVDLKAGPSAFEEFKIPGSAFGGIAFTL